MVNGWMKHERGIHYSICKGKVWIDVPFKKGTINGKPCEYPLGDFEDPDAQRGFVGIIQFLFSRFAQTPHYVSFEAWERKEKMREAREKMTFVDLPSKIKKL